MTQDEIGQLRAERDQALEKLRKLQGEIRPLAEQAKRAGQQRRPGQVVHIGPSEPIDIAPNAVPIKVQPTTSFWAGFTFTIGGMIALALGSFVLLPLFAFILALFGIGAVAG